MMRSAPFPSTLMSLCSLQRNSPHPGLLCFGLLLFSTVMAHASCPDTSLMVSTIVGFAKSAKEHPEIESQLKGMTLDPQELACVRLALVRLNRHQTTTPATTWTYWYPNLGGDDSLTGTARHQQETASEAQYYNDCSASDCRQAHAIFQLLKDTCLELATDKTTCGAGRKGIKGFRTPLPGWRKGLGGVMIGVGALGAILGGVHLGIPLFVNPDSCVQNGLLFPCVADRYEVGGTVLGAGLLTIGGGILTLAVP